MTPQLCPLCTSTNTVYTAMKIRRRGVETQSRRYECLDCRCVWDADSGEVLAGKVVGDSHCTKQRVGS